MMMRLMMLTMKTDDTGYNDNDKLHNDDDKEGK